MKKPSSAKVIATFGVLFISIFVYILPMFLYWYWIGINQEKALNFLPFFAMYYFEIRTLANWLGKKYKEIV